MALAEESTRGADTSVIGSTTSILSRSTMGDGLDERGGVDERIGNPQALPAVARRACQGTEVGGTSQDVVPRTAKGPHGREGGALFGIGDQDSG